MSGLHDERSEQLSLCQGAGIERVIGVSLRKEDGVLATRKTTQRNRHTTLGFTSRSGRGCQALCPGGIIVHDSPFCQIEQVLGMNLCH